MEKFEGSGIKLPPEMFDAVGDEAAGDWGN